MMKTKLNIALTVILNLLAPGMGHAYYGYLPIGIGILTFGIAMSLGLSLFVVLGPWAYGVATAIVAIYYGIILYWTYSLTKKHERKPQRLWIIVLVVYFAVIWPMDRLRRVKTYGVTSDNMIEGLLKGDSIAVDMSHTTDLAVGDIVLVRLPDRKNEFLRRVQSLEGDSLVVGAKDYRIQNDTITAKDIVGKVIYIAFSTSSDPFQIRFDRFLIPLPKE